MFINKIKKIINKIINGFKIAINFVIEKKIIFIVILVTSLFIFGIIRITNNSKENENNNEEISNEENIDNDKIVIKISGEVNNTFYGEINKGMYLFDIINKYCNGFTEYADVSNIDLGRVVDKDFNINVIEDSIKKDNTIYIEDISTIKNIKYKYVGLVNNRIVIYKCDKDLSDEDFEVITKNKIYDDNLININKCSINDLTTLKGIGQSKAQDIIDYRNQNGPFQNIEELVENKLVSESVFNSIKDLICAR